MPYLFAHFKTEMLPEGEQIRFAVSEDGVHWEALNGERPVVTTEVGEKGARDPFVVQNPKTGIWYLIATDLHVGLAGDWVRAKQRGSHDILVWESDDLVEWRGPRLLKLAPDAETGCTWAPEAIWDEERQAIFVFWSAMTGEGAERHLRIWGAYTQDFREVTKPELFSESIGNDLIDMTIVHEGERYYRFTKDNKKMRIEMETAPGLRGPWEKVPGFPADELIGYEGPEIFRLQTGEWGLLLDHFSKGRGYRMFVTRDLSKGDFSEKAEFSLPYPFRHGGVCEISAECCEALRKRYPASPRQ